MLFAASLFAFWVALSGKLDAFHLGAGAAASLAIAWSSRGLWRLEPAHEPVARAVSWRWPPYIAWLGWQVVVSSVQVAWLVLHPRLPIDPRIVRFRRKLPHPLAHLTLANSITLTPGTVTLEVDGDEYVIHAINAESASSVRRDNREGEMPRRVASLFEERA